jgi:hypothetical protein
MRSDSLSLAALKYAAGDLDAVEADAFELRLADDADAREALAEAMRLSTAAAGHAEPKPDPLFQSLVVERLRPATSFLSTAIARRPYRGHPLTWTTAGAGTTACAAVALWLALPTPEPVLTTPIPSTRLATAHPPQPMPLSPQGKTDVRDSSATSTADTQGTTSVGGTDADPKAGRPATFLPEPPQAPGGTNFGPFGDG